MKNQATLFSQVDDYLFNVKCKKLNTSFKNTAVSRKIQYLIIVHCFIFSINLLFREMKALTVFDQNCKHSVHRRIQELKREGGGKYMQKSVGCIYYYLMYIIRILFYIMLSENK